MRKFKIPIIALAVGLLISSFTVRNCVNVFFVYNSGPQNARSSYTETQTSQSVETGTTVLVWIRICVEGGTITNAVFDCAFEELDTVNDSNNSLDDDVEKTINVTCTVDIEVQLEKGEA